MNSSIPMSTQCLSHIMKKRQSLCKKHAPTHYHLAMHVIGKMSQAQTMVELEDLFISASIVFSSPCSGPNVKRHFDNLQLLLQGQDIDDCEAEEEDFGEHRVKRKVEEEGEKETRVYVAPRQKALQLLRIQRPTESRPSSTHSPTADPSTLSQKHVNFDTYSAVVSFVNTGNVHWKLLMAEALLEAYPEKPKMTLRTTETCMVAQRTRMALTIIKASGM
ncbi:hypothetical protein GBF38_000022 [Nibea albiflora]|nr:hypothetical protein GBF38_000022 [Nibea albiflora]